MIEERASILAELAPTAPPSQRIQGLLRLGISPQTIASALGVSASTVRNWSSGKSVPRGPSAQTLDDLRVTAQILVDGGLQPEYAATWLTSRDHVRLDRPVDRISDSPLEVFEAARSVLIGLHGAVPARPSEAAPAPTQPVVMTLDAPDDGNAEDADEVGPALREAGFRIENVRSALAEMVARDPQAVFGLDPYEFEQVVADLYARQGFEVKLTPRSNDAGVDLYAVSFTPFGPLLTIVDCKRYAPDRRVEVDVVRTLYGTLHDKNASSGVIVTTSSFTRGAEAFQRRYPFRIGLQDFNALKRLLRETYRIGPAPSH